MDPCQSVRLGFNHTQGIQGCIKIISWEAEQDVLNYRKQFHKVLFHIDGMSRIKALEKKIFGPVKEDGSRYRSYGTDQENFADFLTEKSWLEERNWFVSSILPDNGEGGPNGRCFS